LSYSLGSDILLASGLVPGERQPGHPSQTEHTVTKNHQAPEPDRGLATDLQPIATAASSNPPVRRFSSLRVRLNGSAVRLQHLSNPSKVYVVDVASGRTIDRYSTLGRVSRTGHRLSIGTHDYEIDSTLISDDDVERFVDAINGRSAHATPDRDRVVR
jgi:hypothetical protein